MRKPNDQVQFETAFLGVLREMSTALKEAPEKLNETLEKLNKLSRQLDKLQSSDLPLLLGKATNKEKMQAVKTELDKVLKADTVMNNELKKGRTDLLKLVKEVKEEVKEGLQISKK